MALANQKELAKVKGTVEYKAGTTVVAFNATITVQLDEPERQKILDALTGAFRKVADELGLKVA
jgi:hypothetical protein